MVRTAHLKERSSYSFEVLVVAVLTTRTSRSTTWEITQYFNITPKSSTQDIIVSPPSLPLSLSPYKMWEGKNLSLSTLMSSHIRGEGLGIRPQHLVFIIYMAKKTTTKSAKPLATILPICLPKKLDFDWEIVKIMS